VRFDSAFTFEYSPREGAPSAKWVDDVPADAKNRRLQELMALQRRITEEKAAACQGLEYEVLIESASKKSDLELMGRTTCNRVMVVPADPRLKPGVMVTARVQEVSSFTLRGVVTQIEGREA